MRAALLPDIDLVKLLLEHGADVNQTNYIGQTVLDLLSTAEGVGSEAKAEQREISKLCRKHIYDSNNKDIKPLLK